MTDVAVIIPTYNRADIVLKCLTSLQNNLVYTGGTIRYYVGCDGDDDTPEKLKGLPDVTVFTVSTGSLGANLNRLIKSTEEPVLVQMDDDHILNESININDIVSVLMNKESRVGWVRLMGVGYHNFRASLEGHFWLVQWNSPELYITSNRPHVKSREFHQIYGLYPEKKKLGQTEEIFCHTCKDVSKSLHGARKLHVAIPLGKQFDSYWDHVGHSWQQKGK